MRTQDEDDGKTEAQSRGWLWDHRTGGNQRCRVRVGADAVFAGVVASV